MDKVDRDRLRALVSRFRSRLPAREHHPNCSTSAVGRLSECDCYGHERCVTQDIVDEVDAGMSALLDALDATEAAIADAAKPFLAESDLIEFYKARMVEHRTNAIASRKRAEKAEAEMVAKAEDLADSIAKAVDESADRRISELSAQLATIRRATVETIVRRLRELGSVHYSGTGSGVGMKIAADFIEREFLTEKGGA